MLFSCACRPERTGRKIRAGRQREGEREKRREIRERGEEEAGEVQKNVLLVNVAAAVGGGGGG